ncbi:hypothetical protein BDU57DRAFT_505197 [Ampelomyces quisqualis]|uniref:Uncharacterized protein n=1 Tax=Ampelomyces quisqualis TaxID=50730 RepID=A0A6A5QAR0_AMPQU|nr:hypothetical protein BDU57DRAFT_505197 [Ampelomyces quisqualis]
MDIEQWLKETAEAEAPHVPAQNTASNFFSRAEHHRPLFQESGARKRTKSDSSLLRPQPVSQVAPPENPNLPTESSPDVNSEAARSSPIDSAESESSCQPYARRPRRKTRAERYEPKQKKERGNHVHRSRRNESKKTSRKSKLKEGEKKDSGVAQSFYAKNVSRDRLTLKPKDHLGIFNKGKTSNAVRGRGLPRIIWFPADMPVVPDLVFSEMKFLQRDKDTSGPATQHGASTKKRKKDHVHTKEGDISAFFTSVRPTPKERDSNVPTDRARQNNDVVDKTARRERELSQNSDSIVPTIEMPGNGSYLGFGNRGPQHESTGYVSWSESIRAPDMTTRHRKQLPAVLCRQDVSSRHRPLDSHPFGTTDRFKGPTHSSQHASKPDMSVERFKMSSVVPGQFRVSRSHSYPRDTSSPRKVNMVDHATQFTSTASVASPNSMPPSLLIRAGAERQRVSQEGGIELPSSGSCPRIQQQIRVVDEGNTADVEQGTSPDLERVIQHCNHTFREQQLRANEADDEHISTYANNVPRYDRPEIRSAAQRRPSVRFSTSEMLSPRLPNFVDSSIYEQQAQQRQDVLPVMFEGEEDLENSYSYLLADGLFAGQEAAFDHGDISDAARIWDDREALLYCEAGTATGESPPDEVPTSGDMVQRMSLDNGVVAPGFWRPNRLY